MSLGEADPDIIFIAGTGRSGTTWLAELLARSTRRRLVFEPFRNDRVPEWSGARSRQYIRPDDREAPFFEPARKILDASFRNEWADYYNERIFTRGRIVKDIRANLMLRWLYEQFGPFPIVFLIRHPGAVAASWSRERWLVDLEQTFLQPDLIEDHLERFKEDLAAAASDPFASILWTWAVETFVPLRQFGEGEILVLFYEDLVRDPTQELKRLSRYVQENIVIRAGHLLLKPSATTTPGVSYVEQVERLDRWRAELTEDQQRSVTSMLTRAGLDRLYGSDGLPVHRVAEVAKR